MNIILDYNVSFTPEVIHRLADIGQRSIYVFDLWDRHEPEQGRYHFDEIISHARTCRSAGIRMLLQTPVGSPLWMDRSFYLRNEFGQDSSFLELQGSRFFQDSNVLSARIPSYWNSEAEECTVRYIRAVHDATKDEGVLCVPSIGHVGEYMFPAVHWLNIGYASSPWWFDEQARRLRQDRDPAEWFIEERRGIIAGRLSLYKEKWLQFVPYFDSWDDWQFGNIGISAEMNTYGKELKTILFTVFLNDENFPGIAKRQAVGHPVWGGAEGCANVVANTRRALTLGLQGTLCRLVDDPWLEDKTIPDWKYDALQEADRLFFS
jgi:hypothetical protein